MEEPSDDVIRTHVLYKLHMKLKWGGSHTHIETIKKGVPSHLGGKYVDVAMKLIKEGLLLCKPTSYGMQISLNPGRAKEIREMVERFAEDK